MWTLTSTVRTVIYAVTNERCPSEDAVVGALVVVRIVVSATATGIMVGTPVVSIGAKVVGVVGVVDGTSEGDEEADEVLPEGRILGGLASEGSCEGRPVKEEGSEEDVTGAEVDGINDGEPDAST